MAHTSSFASSSSLSVPLLAILLWLIGAAHCRPTDFYDDQVSDGLNELDKQMDLFSLDEEEIEKEEVVEDEQATGAPLNSKDLAYGLLYGNDETDSPNFTRDDPILRAGLFEGDIAGVKASDFDGRNAIVSKSLRWPDGKIPYKISSKFDEKERAVIAEAMEHIHKHTCIKFLPRNDEKDYLHLKKGDGCSSAVGRRGGEQEVTLGTGCVYKGIVVHELTHSIGFWHEQSRPDRDEYVIVEWKNIKPGLEHNFRKYDKGGVSTLGLDYDINSIMHYGPYSFSRSADGPSIRVRKAQDDNRMGQREAYTALDIKKVNRLYNCHAQRRWSHF